MNERLSTRNLADILTMQTGLDKERAEKFIDILSSYIAQGIEKNKHVKVIGLGTFKVVLVRERESVHIQTGERFVIPAHHKLSFVPDKDLKEQINRPFAFFEPIEATEDLSSFDKQSSDMEKATETEQEFPVVMLDDEITEDLPEEIKNIYFGKTTEVHPVQDSVDGYLLPATEEEDRIFDQEELYEGAESVRPVITNMADNVDVVHYEYEEVNMYPKDDEEDAAYVDADEQRRGENEEPEEYAVQESGKYNKPVDEKLKKKTIPLWLWFLSLLFFIAAGMGVGTFAFLHYNSDKSYRDVISVVNNSQTDSETDHMVTAPFPIGESRVSDTELETDELRVVDDQEENEGSGQEGNEDITSVSTEKSVNEEPVTDPKNTAENKREKKPVIDWLAPSPENTKPEPKRADKPNQAIEEKNKSLPNTKQNQQNSNNAAPTTNQAKNTSSEKNIPVSVRMTAGSSLTQIALEHYGDKVFWVYIYDYNKSRIKDFNNIPVGTEIRLPQPKTYGINAKNKTSVQKARRKQSELLKWDNWDDYK
ncbi:MAG: HU family DNA-binding protein [Tannerella sp.]|nr:HU family DNA-binding protein [Tannerella sp.]